MQLVLRFLSIPLIGLTWTDADLGYDPDPVEEAETEGEPWE